MEKYILINSANSNLGNELTKKLISENYIVIATDKNFENKKFGNLIYVNMDANNDRSIEYAKSIILKYTSSINAVINLQNYITFDTLLESDEGYLRRSLEENFFTIYKVMKVMWPIIDQGGKIINNCSDVSLYSVAPFNFVYGVSKHMLDIYTDVLRKELSFKGINVVKIHSGYIKDNDHDEILNRYHDLIDESKYLSNDLTRLKELNLNNNHSVSEQEFCNLVISILEKKKPKNAYIFKPNPKLASIGRHNSTIQDKIYKNIGK